MKLIPRSVFVLILVLAFLFTGGTQLSNACGPFSRYAIFSYTKHPDLPFQRYSGGELGIVEPSYARTYLYVAYRLINGGSFNQKESAALSELWNERLDNDNGKESEDLRSVWLAARAKVPGMSPDPKLEVFRAKGKDEYDSFLNCTADAFKTAGLTLEERIAKFGIGSPEVKEWTTAQDQVFANCGGGQIIPDSLASSTSPFLQADRAYQIAAAHFYSMNFDEARIHFERIAADNTSQWHNQAPYLIARSLIRKASLGDEANRNDTLAQAESQLKKVLSGNMEDPLQSSARGLLNLVELRLHPNVRVREIAESLVKKDQDQNLKQELIDYTLLLDKYTSDSDQALDENLKKALDTNEKDDLTDWLLTFQSEDKEASIRSIEKWEKTNSPAWLVSSLSKAEAGDAKTGTLMSAAERVDSASPAFATVQFHVLRLLIAKGEKAAARSKLDSLLQNEARFPASATNKFRHMRMGLATDVDDFFKYAQRRPAAFSWDEDATEYPIDLKLDTELQPWAARALLDADSTSLLNERFPLSLLRDAASNRILPEHIRRQLALAVWTRAAILDDAEIGKAIAPVVVVLAPELKSNLIPYMNATNRVDRQSAALYVILKFPGLRPYVEPSTGRLTPIGERDIYRDNWWCDMVKVPNTNADDAEVTDENSKVSTDAVKPIDIVTLEFLSEAQATIASREHAQLLALGAAPDYLAQQTIEWANRSPKDPRVPEALHIAVTATRYGCSDKQTSKWSKAAFQLLHKRYPNTIWAKKTPYWFKEV